MPRRERHLARGYVEQLRIKTRSIYAEAGSLSGGNQQKVALARWLAIRPAVLILDEPTQGVDVGSKSEIHRLMVDLAEQGVAIIMISSELPEILGMSDRIAVMHAGAVAGVLGARKPRSTRSCTWRWVGMNEGREALAGESACPTGNLAGHRHCWHCRPCWPSSRPASFHLAICATC